MGAATVSPEGSRLFPGPQKEPQPSMGLHDEADPEVGPVGRASPEESAIGRKREGGIFHRKVLQNDAGRILPDEEGSLADSEGGEGQILKGIGTSEMHILKWTRAAWSPLSERTRWSIFTVSPPEPRPGGGAIRRSS